MTYGSAADVRIVEQFVPEEEFRKVLKNAPAGLFTTDSWKKWHERFRMAVRRRLSAAFLTVR